MDYMFPVSHSPEQSVSDWAGLILQAHEASNISSNLYIHSLSKDRLYKLGEKVITRIVKHHAFLSHYSSNVYITNRPSLFSIKHDYKLSASKILTHFERYAKEATHCDHRPMAALSLLKERLHDHYYSGVDGKIRSVLNRLLGWFSFEKTPISQRINKLTKIITALPVPLPPRIPMVATHISGEKVFTDNLKDGNAHGALGNYSYARYQVQWMTPREYLNKVDRHFTCAANDERMQSIFTGMEELIQGVKTQKFSPVMLNPHECNTVIEDYRVYEHEGRHRALCADLLKISKIPVAIVSSPTSH